MEEKQDNDEEEVQFPLFQSEPEEDVPEYSPSPLRQKKETPESVFLDVFGSFKIELASSNYDVFELSKLALTLYDVFSKRRLSIPNYV